MICPMCKSVMVKQNPNPQEGELEVVNSIDNGFDKIYFDGIVEWYKCGGEHGQCPMAVYLSNPIM